MNADNVATPQPVRPVIAPTLCEQSPALVSGFGQYHTDEAGKGVRSAYTSITLASIRDLVDSPQATEKSEAQWLIPSTLKSRSFKAQVDSGEFWMLWADLDTDPKPLHEVAAVLHLILDGADFELYTSRSATAEKPKSRILIPLDRPLDGSTWLLNQAIFNEKLLAAGITPDRASERAAQLCYLPNRGDFYDSRSMREGKLFDPALSWAHEAEQKLAAQQQVAEALRINSDAAKSRREALSLGSQPNTIGAFNLAYTVQDILLAKGYAQRGDNFRHPNSESGSYSASVKSGRVHTLSSSDPLYTDGGGGGAHDAFSAFVVLFADGDHSRALKLAGDDWLMVGGASWNKVKQQEYMNAQAHSMPPVDLSGILSRLLRPIGENVATVSPAVAGSTFQVVDYAGVLDASPPEPKFWIEQIVPERVVTLLGAHGGTGKSMLGLIAAVCLATGIPFMGKATTRARVLFYSAEDPAEVLLWRLSCICKSMGMNQRALVGWLTIIDVTEDNPALFHEVSEGGVRRGATTPTYERLRAEIERTNADVVIIDNASDTFDANENERARVRGFLRSLAKMVKKSGGAILLLAHIDKNAARAPRNADGGSGTSEGYSGSTAWHNSVRSRLFLTELPNGSLMLEHQKSNLGKKSDPIYMDRAEHGVLVLSGGAGGAAAESLIGSANRQAIVALIAEFNNRCEWVPTGPTANNNAFKLFSDEPGFPPRMVRKELWRVIRDAERSGQIYREKYRGVDRQTRERWAVAGAAVALRAHTAGTPSASEEQPAGAPALGGMGEQAHTQAAAITPENEQLVEWV